MSRLLELPSELLISVFSSCSFIERKRLCETCRLLYDVGVSVEITMTAHVLRGPKMPELYRIVDLSCHNSDVDCELLHIDVYHRLPPDFVKRQWTRLDYDLSESQLEFSRTLSHTPGLGKHVRELHWTALDLFDYEDEIWETRNWHAELTTSRGNANATVFQ
jgi:hypothetical protein